MKKFIALMLVLVVALSLCACGGAKSKYVGTYEKNTEVQGYYSGTDYPVQEELILKRDGTGSCITRYSEDITRYNNLTGNEVVFSAKKGDIYEKLSLTWEVVDDCAVVDFSGTRYTVYGQEEAISYSQTYEIKANKLFYINSDIVAFTKIK